MLANHTQRSLETAAVKTLERIRRDRGRVVRRLQPLLQHIEEHLFDPGLDVNQLKRSCGVRDNSVPIQFHAQIGLPPHAYIEECRLRTGCRLLRDTELKIWQIADLLGYSSIQVFSRAFSRWASMRPTGFRRKARREGIAIPSRVVKAQQEGDVAKKAAPQESHAQTNGTAVVEAKRKTNGRANGTRNGKARPKSKNQDKGSRIEVDNLRRALDGELEATDADKLIRRLLNLYPAQGTNGQSALTMPLHLAINGHGTNGHQTNGHRTNGNGTNSVEPNLLAIAAGSVGGLLDVEEIETLRAEELWRKIKDEPFEAQVAAVQHEIRFRTPALFHHLCTRSLVDGRDNRKRGVRVAELALVALEAVKFYITSEKELAILQGKGYAWLGNARRLAMDFIGAERALGTSQDFLPAQKDAAPQEWITQLQSVAALRWSQRRAQEGLEPCNQALGLLENGGIAEELARVFLLRGNLFKWLGRESEALGDFNKAVASLEDSKDAYLLATAFQTLMGSLVMFGRVSDSIQYLPRVRDAVENVGNQTLDSYLRWHEGLIAAERDDVAKGEELMKSARAGFLAVDETATAAVVSLDLAVIFSQQGRASEMIELVGQVLPLLEALDLRPEALVLVTLLKEAMVSSSISAELLRRMKTEAARRL